MVKKDTAVLWKHKLVNSDDYGYGICLDKPLLCINPDTGQSSSGFEVIKQVPLPEPMTSNQFNKFIDTDAGQRWAKRHLSKAMGVST